MALLKYLKPAKDCLPDPKRSLAVSVPPRVINSANLIALIYRFNNCLQRTKLSKKGKVLTRSK